VRKITSVNAHDPWPSISELVQYALADESSAEFSERVRRAYRISPRKGQAIFLKLLGNPQPQVSRSVRATAPYSPHRLSHHTPRTRLSPGDPAPRRASQRASRPGEGIWSAH
jgi:hypothetical protein